MPHEMPGISAVELEYIEKKRRFKSHSHHIPWRQILRSRNMWALMWMFHLYMWGAYYGW